ncbi:alpha-2-macroglobulin-like protein 1 [Anabrus simplex]|uniref:alpha-2-macroglobulin-like protein 1 n=1 Tax=Anabrus simplex TaxID=316456 RepID=UPI0035A2A1F3
MCAKLKALLLLFSAGVGVALANRGFLLTAPKRLLAGTTETFCLSLHNVTGSAHVEIDVLRAESDDKIASAQYHLATGSDSCLELSIPPTLETRGRLHLQARFDDAYDYIINSVKEIRIQHEPFLIFIETDKTIYKPGQEVKFRVLVLNHDFTPINNVIAKISVESPSEVHLAQWRDVKAQEGLVQKTFQLAQEPQQGQWKIKVELNKEYAAVQTRTFEVREYVLPRFGVTIKPPDYVLADASFLVWKICAKYSYGQPVRGQLHLKAEPQVPTWRQGSATPPEINFITELKSNDGCYELNVTGADLGLPEWDVTPSSIIVSAFVTEAGTDVVENATSESTVIHQALQLEFLPHSSRYFKPGLPYIGKIKVLQPNNAPKSGTSVQLCLKVRRKGEWNRTLIKCRNFTSDADGLIKFLVPPQDHDIELLSFVATTVYYQTKYYSPDKRWRVFMDQPSAFFDVHSWYSPSKSYIEIVDKDEKNWHCNGQHYFELYYTSQLNARQPFHYLVTSRGDIIHTGQLYPEETTKYQGDFDDFPNTLATNNDIRNNSKRTNISEKQNKLKINTLPFSLHILPIMSPLSFLLVYYVRDDGEVAAATHSILPNKCFANKVKAKFVEKQQHPGAEVSLQVEAAPKSLCAITAVDKSTHFLSTSNILNTDQVFSALNPFHIEPFNMPRQADNVEYCSKKLENMKDLEPHAEESHTNPGVAEPPFWDLRRRKRSSVANQGVAPSSKYVDAIQAFDDFGAVVMSDLTLETRPCNSPVAAGVSRSMVYFSTPPRAYPLTEVDYNEEIQPNTAEVRTYFPETWLWELLYIGDEGSLQVKRELPDSITEWVGNTVCISPALGLGISPPVHLTAFQPFFLDYSMPYSIKRGEILHLKTSLFNYLDYSLPVRISFIDSPGIELLSNSSITVVCVKGHESFVHQFRLKAVDLGELNVTVSAEIDPLYPEECGPEMVVNRRDTLVKPIRVEAEGFPVELTKSTFVCPANFSGDTNILWTLELPTDVVEDSARADISVVGDLLGPALQNLDQLVRLPMGCGEQNMILFVPNLHVINYLNATNNLNSVIMAEAIKNMEKGYQRELNYRHSDGSYSAFGSSDSEGSMWLTAFVVKSFAQARSHIFIDEKDLKISLQWIIKRQLENGCFPMVGQVFHKDIKGGLTGETSSSGLTAYVLISLLETGIPLPPSVKSNAVFCLQGDKEPDLYSLALKTYALVLMGEKQLAEEALEHLLGVASRQQDLLWWEKPETTPETPSLGLSVEITAYVILSLVKMGKEEHFIHALKAVRWIAKHRNSHGGFVSTQDTVVALEALAKYSVLLPQKETALNVFIGATEIQHQFEISNEERMILKMLPLPVLPTQVEIIAEGEGCALIQSSLRYNVRTPSGSDAFELDVKTGPVSSVDICTVQRLELCIRYKLPGQNSNMAVLEVNMVSGYAPDRSSLYKLAQERGTNLKRWEEEKEAVNFYFEELTNKRQCIGFLVMQETEVENPSYATVKLYDYYQQELSISQKYSTDAGCRNERLPHPEANVASESTGNSVEDEPFNGNGTGQMQSDSSTAENINTTDTLDHLNPLFVNVDHDLETPSGNEGPEPVYALPQADRGVEEPTEVTSCPTCEETTSSSFAALYCNSTAVYKLAVRKGNHARLLLDMSPRRLPKRIRKLVSLRLNNNCKCKLLEKVGDHIVVLDSKDRSLQGYGQNIPQLPLDSSVHIYKVAVHHGQPENIKQARSYC